MFTGPRPPPQPQAATAAAASKFKQGLKISPPSSIIRSLAPSGTTPAPSQRALRMGVSQRSNGASFIPAIRGKERDYNGGATMVASRIWFGLLS